MYLVSACLVGINCRYRGRRWSPASDILAALRRGEALPVCPEQLGGLPTPRPPAEIVGGNGEDVWKGRARVVDASGRDVTAFFKAGAEEVLALAERAGIRAAVLQEKSPSCGVRLIHDGSFQERLRPGPGVTTALLQAHGLQVTGYEPGTHGRSSRIPARRQKGPR